VDIRTHFTVEPSVGDQGRCGYCRLIDKDAVVPQLNKRKPRWLSVLVIRMNLSVIDVDLFIRAGCVEGYARTENREGCSLSERSSCISNSINCAAHYVEFAVLIDAEPCDLLRRIEQQLFFTAIQHQDFTRAVIAENVRSVRECLLVPPINVA